MSVWPQKTAASLLSGSNGVLVSVSIHVDPRHLESLLEALAQVSFPINPQIYHDASMVYRYADGREVTEATTLVEFPAYAGQMDEAERALAAYGFDPAAMHVTDMLEEIHAARAAESEPEPAPKGAAYVTRRRVKYASGALLCASGPSQSRR
ncbi:MAG TPA: hypothetical protein VKU19_20295 [Bryobacteraceae bacterium]|nr:hypothetical protein [Bryobacteraceae bacterium]